MNLGHTRKAHFCACAIVCAPTLEVKTAFHRFMEKSKVYFFFHFRFIIALFSALKLSREKKWFAVEKLSLATQKKSSEKKERNRRALRDPCASLFIFINCDDKKLPFASHDLDFFSLPAQRQSVVV